MAFTGLLKINSDVVEEVLERFFYPLGSPTANSKYLLERPWILVNLSDLHHISPNNQYAQTAVVMKTHSCAKLFLFISNGGHCAPGTFHTIHSLHWLPHLYIDSDLEEVYGELFCTSCFRFCSLIPCF